MDRPTPDVGFQARLARIGAKNAPEPGPVQNADRRRRGPALTLPGLPRLEFDGIIAGFLAAGALMVANVTAFSLRMAPPGPGDFFGKTMAAMGPWGMTAAMLFVLMVGLGLRDKRHVIAIALALPLMWLCEPYLAYLMPGLWADLYSPEHVDTMLIMAGLKTPLPVP